MIFPNIKQQLNSTFKNSQLPTLVYINKQEFNRNKIERPLHKHDSICEIVLVYKGSGTYLINNERYYIKEGDVIFYNQGDLHEISSSTDTEIGDYCLGITNLQKIGLNFNQLIKPDEAIVRPSQNLFSTLKNLCEEMYTLSNLNEHGNLASQLLCSSFIIITSQLSSFITKQNTSTKEMIFMSRIYNYFNTNFTEKFTLDDVAQHLGCSSSYISHLFKHNTGLTPIQYIIRRRLGLAQTLLISTDLSVTHIATKVGYENPNYFITSFTKIIGMTPLRYRHFYLKEMRGTRNQF